MTGKINALGGQWYLLEKPQLSDQYNNKLITGVRIENISFIKYNLIIYKFINYNRYYVLT